VQQLHRGLHLPAAGSDQRDGRKVRRGRVQHDWLGVVQRLQCRVCVSGGVDVADTRRRAVCSRSLQPCRGCVVHQLQRWLCLRCWIYQRYDFHVRHWTVVCNWLR
jgi:hypothetical protein